MALTIHQEEDAQRQLQVKVEVPEERVQKEMRRKARVLARELHVPGFRPGKAPYNVIVSRVGEDALRAEAADGLLQAVFQEMLEEIAVEPYAQVKADNPQMNPLTFEFVVPLSPVTELGDYRSIRQAKEVVAVTDEAVADALEHLRTHHEVVEPVDRPVQAGDIATVGGTGSFVDANGNAQPLFNEERTDLLMDEDVLFKGTPFVAGLLGHEAGDGVEIAFTFPEDYDDDTLAGRDASFQLTILDVKKRELPELDDDLAKQDGKYETLDELRDALRSELEKQAEQQARNDFLEQMLDEMLALATLNYPPAALEAELDELVEDLKTQVTRSGWEWDDYLRLQNESEEALREQMQENAATRLKRNLILTKFAVEEKLTLAEDAMAAAIEKQVSGFEQEGLRDYMRNYFLNGPGRETLASQLLMDLIVDRLEAIGAGNAPDLDALVEEAETTADEVSADEVSADEVSVDETAEDETSVDEASAAPAEMAADEAGTEAAESPEAAAAE
ncbi:MAG: trigger factor [Ardenticatenaceae bacterium]|nr:trigger factor [Anaerolineales bacterium]MCB8917088.1 trigger factor [Ardenticatenaceae bacterium]